MDSVEASDYWGAGGGRFGLTAASGGKLTSYLRDVRLPLVPGRAQIRANSASRALRKPPQPYWAPLYAAD